MAVAIPRPSFPGKSEIGNLDAAIHRWAFEGTSPDKSHPQRPSTQSTAVDIRSCGAISAADFMTSRAMSGICPIGLAAYPLALSRLAPQFLLGPTLGLTDAAPLASDLNPRRYRGVRCIRLVRRPRLCCFWFGYSLLPF